MVCFGAPSTAGPAVVVWWRRKTFDRVVWKGVREVKCRVKRRALARVAAIFELSCWRHNIPRRDFKTVRGVEGRFYRRWMVMDGARKVKVRCN